MKIKKINITLSDEFIVSFSNFFLAFYLARIMNSEGYGLYVFAFTVLVFCVALLNCAIGTPLAVLGASYKGEKWNKFISNCFIIYILLSVVLLFFMFMSAYILVGGKHNANGVVLIHIGAILFFYLGHEFVRKTLFTMAKLYSVLFVDIIAHTSRMFMILFFSYIGEMNYIKAIYVLGLSSLLGYLFGIFLCGIKINKDYLGLDSEILRKIWEFSKWTLADWLPFILYGQLYIYVVTFTLGNVATGILGACRNLVAPLRVVLGGLSNLLLPYFSNLYQENGEAKLVKSLKSYCLFSIIGVSIYVILVSLYAKTILLLFYGKYGQYQFLVVFYGLSFIFMYLYSSVEIYLKVIMCPKMVFMGRVLTAIVSVMTCYPLVKLFNVHGAVLSIFISHVTMCLSLFLLAYKLSHKKSNRFSNC